MLVHVRRSMGFALAGMAALWVLAGSADAKPRNPPPQPAPVVVAAPAPAPVAEAPRTVAGEFAGAESLIPVADGRARSRKASPLKGTSYLFVETVPEHADVRIDGNPEGRGRVFLRLRDDRLVAVSAAAPGYESVEGFVELREAEVSKFRLVLRPATSGLAGSLTVLTEPTGAEVAVDGVAAGTTPVTVRRVPEGRHEVSLRSGSWFYSEVTDVRSGQVMLVSVPVGASPPAVAPVPQPVARDRKSVV